MDPRHLDSIDWNQIYQAIFLTALFALSGIAFLGCLLLAQAIVPSLVATGHMRPTLGRVRLFFYPVAIAALSIALWALFQAVGLIKDILDFYPRFWQ